MPTADRPDANERRERERRRSARLLRESEARLRCTFELVQVGVAHVALTGETFEVNARLCEILGRPREGLIGARLHDITHPQEHAATLEPLDALLRGRREHFSVETRLLRSDATVIWTQFGATLVRDANGAPSHVVALIDDITEDHRSRDLQVSVATEQRTSLARQEFLSRLSHELRTPLNAVLGFAQLLRAEPEHALTPAQRDKVARIETAGKHLLAMIDDVLDLSRLDTGVVALVLGPVSLDAAVRQALKQLGETASAAGVTLDHTPAPLTLLAHADARRLQQVLLQLLSNAIKFNRRAGSVSVWCQRRAELVGINVADTGVGLSAEQRSRLFEPFDRLGAEKTAIPGTGIGLAITAKLVALMGGHVDVESEPGAGARFSVWLPAVEPPVPPPPPVPVATAQRATLTVLYADDNHVNVELVRQVLRLRPGCVLKVARNGAQAIELTRSDVPDLLLLDMQLGDMSAFDVVSALERDAATARVPRIALASDACPEDVRTARTRGFLAYLTKPLDVAALLRCIDDQLAAHPPGNGRT